MKTSPSDDSTVQFLDAPDELRRRSSEIVAPDDPAA
jgi:hypothetical protein